jgi:glycerol-3-phosphate dehydrogenase
VLKRDLGALAAREHDVLVVGAGIHGAAAAWDAAQRGLSVAVVEARDFGSGVSWNSLKTVHGGLRHLQRLQPGLTRESMRERRALLRVAPELVRPLRFLVPCYGHGRGGRGVLGLGLLANDWLTPDRNQGLAEARRIPRGRTLTRSEVLELVPALPERGLTGGAVWCDAQLASSERLLIGFLHAASSQGAAVANHAEACGLLRCGARVAGARVRDLESGGELEVRARMVLNAAGPGMDAVLGLAGLSRPPAPLLLAMNLVLRRAPLSGYALGARSHGRYLFLVPWRDRAIVGTAYAAAESPPQPQEFLAEAARAYPWADLVPADVTLVHRGLVPGWRPDQLWDRSLVVDHEVEDGRPGLVSLLGVKYTTARGVAERAVDVVARRLRRRAAPCRTAETLLPAARMLEGSLDERTRTAVREEAALHLADAVLRRLDLGTGGPPSADDLDVVAGTMAAELGWDERRLEAERSALADTYRVNR